MYRQQHSPTQDAGNDQVSDNRQQEFHALILAALHRRASE
jgi:hypothetical protein